jgi:hypothetical protein
MRQKAEVMAEFEEYQATCCDSAKEKLLWLPTAKQWYHYDDRFEPILYCPWCGKRLTDVGRRFPIQKAGTVPWESAEKAYETYARLFGKSQSLERLAERGGFGVSEFCALFLGSNPAGCSREKLDAMIVTAALLLSDDWVLL